MRAVLASAVAAALVASAALAQPQAASEEVQDLREALADEIARMQAEIAGIERLMRWQSGLARTARTDRAEALRQRLPMSDCRESALAPLCEELTGLFRPEEGEEASPPPPGIGEGAP